MCHLAYRSYHSGLELDLWISRICNKVKTVRDDVWLVLHSIACGFCRTELGLIGVCRLVQVEMSGPLLYIKFS